MSKSRCDWRGPICTVNKECDRVVGWEVTHDGETIFRSDVKVSFDEHGYYIDGIKLPPETTINPVIEPGAEIVVRRGCAKRQDHRGSHGFYRWQLWTRKWKR